MAEEKKNKGNIGKIIVIILLVVIGAIFWQKGGSVNSKVIQILESIDKNVKGMKDNTDDIKPIKEDADAIKKDTKEMKDTVGEIKKDTGAIRTKVEECLTCGQKKTVAILAPAPKPSCTDDCPGWNAAPRSCGNGGYQYCGNYRNTDSCLHWSTCITTEKPYVSRSKQVCQGRDIVWLDSNGIYSETIQSCQDATETKCFGDDLKERTIRMKCVGDPYCAKDGYSGWRTIENCSFRCGCIQKRTEKRCWNGDIWSYSNGERQEKIEECGGHNLSDEYRYNGDRLERKRIERGCENSRCTSEVIWNLAERCDNGCSNNRCREREQEPATVPAAAVEQTTVVTVVVISNPPADAEAEEEQIFVPSTAAVPLATGCTQNCAPKEIEQEFPGTIPGGILGPGGPP